MRVGAAFQLGVCLLLVGCRDCGNEPLQRMIRQPKVKAYEASSFFEDGRAMRRPPEGTVPRERALPSPAMLADGTDGGVVENNPLSLTRELLQQGRKRFEVTCATCHGLTGESDTLVAQNMALRPPPNLVTLERTDGQVFRVISEGFGLMPSFGFWPVEDRWATVAYLRALQLSQRAEVDLAPEPQRSQLLEEVGR